MFLLFLCLTVIALNWLAVISFILLVVLLVVFAWSRPVWVSVADCTASFLIEPIQIAFRALHSDTSLTILSAFTPYAPFLPLQ